MVSKDETSPSGGGHFLSGRPRVLIGVTGGIAAYKTAILVRRLKEWGADVTVVPTPAALDMVGKVTWEALSGNEVHVDVAEATHKVAHVRTGQDADLIVIAPATANSLAKIRLGIADNMLMASVLVATCPVIVAPAMHTEMWNNAATQENIEILRQRGFEFAGPVDGRLTGKDSGTGRMMEPEKIASLAIERLVSLGWTRRAPFDRDTHGSLQSSDLSGKTVLISTGGTHEAIDPVRFIANRSSGRMGVEIAKAAAIHGAHIVVVGANLGEIVKELPEGVELIDVQSALDLQREMVNRAPEADVIVMAAAVSDYRVAARSDTKLKRGGDVTLHLVENPDILHDLAHNRRRDDQLVVGFAAETGDSNLTYLEYGQLKAERKGADLIAINEVGTDSGFGDVETRLTIIDASGDIHGDFSGSKAEVAAGLVGVIAESLASSR